MTRQPAPPRSAPKPAPGGTAGLSQAEAQRVLDREMAQPCSYTWPDEDLSLPPGHRPAQWFLGWLLMGLALWAVIGSLVWIAIRWLS